MHSDATAFIDQLRIEQKSPRTITRYGEVLRELDEFTQGAPPASSTREQLRRFAAAPCANGKPRSPAGVNLRVAVVRTLFGYLVAERGYAMNPTHGMKGVPVPRRIPKHLTLREMTSLVRHVASEPGKLSARNLAIVVVLWQTALRVGELGRLRVAQLDREARLLRDVVLKGGHVADVVLNDETLAVLERYLAERGELPPDAPLIARHGGGALSVRAIQMLFEGWRSDLGWTRPLHPHVLRHTHATQALAEGVDVATVADLLRHRGLKTVMVYATVEDQARREALRKLGRLVPPGLVEGWPVPTPSKTSPTRSNLDPADFPCVEEPFDEVA